MGLFNDAKLYGGTFYRSFSQFYKSDDLNLYFHDDPIVYAGVCAGSAWVWLEYYLTLPDDDNQDYSNEMMKKNRNKIITIQRGLRQRDQSLSDLLILAGFEPHEYIPFK